MAASEAQAALAAPESPLPTHMAVHAVPGAGSTGLQRARERLHAALSRNDGGSGGSSAPAPVLRGGVADQPSFQQQAEPEQGAPAPRKPREPTSQQAGQRKPTVLPPIHLQQSPSAFNRARPWGSGGGGGHDMKPQPPHKAGQAMKPRSTRPPQPWEAHHAASQQPRPPADAPPAWLQHPRQGQGQQPSRAAGSPVLLRKGSRSAFFTTTPMHAPAPAPELPAAAREAMPAMWQPSSSFLDLGAGIGGSPAGRAAPAAQRAGGPPGSPMHGGPPAQQPQPLKQCGAAAVAGAALSSPPGSSRASSAADLPPSPLAEGSGASSCMSSSSFASRGGCNTDCERGGGSYGADGGLDTNDTPAGGGGNLHGSGGGSSAYGGGWGVGDLDEEEAEDLARIYAAVHRASKAAAAASAPQPQRAPDSSWRAAQAAAVAHAAAGGHTAQAVQEKDGHDEEDSDEGSEQEEVCGIGAAGGDRSTSASIDQAVAELQGLLAAKVLNIKNELHSLTSSVMAQATGSAREGSGAGAAPWAPART